MPRSFASAARRLIAGSLLTVSGVGSPLSIGGAISVVDDLLLLVMSPRASPE